MKWKNPVTFEFLHSQNGSLTGAGSGDAFTFFVSRKRHRSRATIQVLAAACSAQLQNQKKRQLNEETEHRSENSCQAARASRRARSVAFADDGRSFISFSIKA
jgi:hypothetical protein